VTLCWAGW